MAERALDVKLDKTRSFLSDRKICDKEGKITSNGAYKLFTFFEAKKNVFDTIAQAKKLREFEEEKLGIIGNPTIAKHITPGKELLKSVKELGAKLGEWGAEKPEENAEKIFIELIKLGEKQAEIQGVSLDNVLRKFIK
jgi:hypothetical protein